MARFAVVVGETTIASFATPEEADNVCIQLAMAYHATPLTISYAPVARGSSAGGRRERVAIWDSGARAMIQNPDDLKAQLRDIIVRKRSGLPTTMKRPCWENALDTIEWQWLSDSPRAMTANPDDLKDACATSIRDSEQKDPGRMKRPC